MWQFWSLTVLGDPEDHEDFEQEMVKLMKSIPTQELHEIDRIKSFLEEVMTWAYCAAEHIKGMLHIRFESQGSTSPLPLQIVTMLQ